MRTVATVADTRAAIADARRQGHRIGFVPTMGALHAGHLSLVDRVRQDATFVVASIFVNPLQFGPTEDFAKYPRDPAGDGKKLASRGVDLLFRPEREEVYPGEQRITVEPGALAADWEGAVRPGHFAGVLTVVLKLFNIVLPDVAVFGQKDLQQITLIETMVRELNVPVKVIMAPTVRESDGLAMSSRNAYLAPAHRAQATALFRALGTVREAFERGEQRVPELEATGSHELDRVTELTVEYFAVVDRATFRRTESAAAGAAVITAARLGGTRLIDNILL